MRRLLMMLIVSALPALAADSAISGTWKVEGSVAGYAVHRLCTFQQEGNKLSGTCLDPAAKPEEKPDTLTAGVVKDKTVTWTYDVNWNGSTLTATYTGTLDSASAISGSIDVQPVNAAGTFTAEKNK